MDIIVGIATFEGREKALKETVRSLQNQVDKIYIYNNSKNKDVRDNGKFYGLIETEKSAYYFTCDDDLIYPDNYIKSMIEDIEKFKCIITHHGKIITQEDYLKGSEQYHFSVRNFENKILDVAGTAVTGFRTDYFNPKSLFYANDFFVSDLLFAIEAKKQNKKILLGQHKTDWIKQNMNINFQKSISYIEAKDQTRQNYFKNKLLNLKWQT